MFLFFKFKLSFKLEEDSFNTQWTTGSNFNCIDLRPYLYIVSIFWILIRSRVDFTMFVCPFVDWNGVSELWWRLIPVCMQLWARPWVDWSLSLNGGRPFTLSRRIIDHNVCSLFHNMPIQKVVLLRQLYA